MLVKIYEYKNCSTCKNALKYLDAKKIKYEKLPIVEQPPSIGELKQMLGILKQQGKTFKNLFNTSGEMYRELGLSEKIKNGMSEDEALKLLAKNGKLVKRPFVLAGKSGIVGFQADAWDLIFK